jgi:hypothetical protein
VGILTVRVDDGEDEEVVGVEGGDAGTTGLVVLDELVGEVLDRLFHSQSVPPFLSFLHSITVTQCIYSQEQSPTHGRER